MRPDISEAESSPRSGGGGSRPRGVLVTPMTFAATAEMVGLAGGFPSHRLQAFAAENDLWIEDAVAGRKARGHRRADHGLTPPAPSVRDGNTGLTGTAPPGAPTDRSLDQGALQLNPAPAKLVVHAPATVYFVGPSRRPRNASPSLTGILAVRRREAVRRWLVIAALAVAPAAYAATYYLSPTGSDSAAGTSETAPWQTWGKVLSTAKLVKPNDTVILLDGVYTKSESGLPLISCGVNANSGTPSAPITIRAKNSRKALILGDGASPTLALKSCAWWSIEGLRIEGQDDAGHSKVDAPVVQFYASDHSAIRDSIVRHPNRYGNNGVIEQYGGSHDNLIEDNEVLLFHRNGIDSACDDCHNITVRRNYINPQRARDAGLAGNRTGPNDGIVVYGWDDSIIENNVVEGAGIGINVAGHGNVTVGNVTNNNADGYLGTHGYIETGTWGAVDDVWTNDVSMDHAIGFFMRTAINSTLTNVSIFGGTGSGVVADNPYDARRANATTACNNRPCTHNHTPGITIVNSVAVGSAGGYAVGNASEFITRVFRFSTGWQNASGTWGGGTETREVATTPPNPPGVVDPLFGACRVFVPDASPLKGKGLGGADIGANVLYRYQDGVLTTTPLWDPATGEFPHGAVIAGVNDVAGQNVFDVHRRLNVNANGCQLPSWYGGAPSPTPIPAPTVTATASGRRP